MSGGLLTCFYRRYAPQASALFAAMTAAPTRDRRILIDDTIKALIACGAWATYDLFYMPAAHALQPALLNWNNPGTFTLSALAGQAPTFTVDRGFAGDGTDDAYDTGFSPLNTVGRKISTNSAHLGMWRTDNVQDNDGDCGNLRLRWVPRSTGNNCTSRGCSSSSNIIFGANTAAQGHYNLYRDNSATYRAYKDGVFRLEPAQVSAAHASANLTICAMNDASAPTFSAAQVGCMHAGMTQTNAMQAAQYAAILRYMQRVGAA